MPPFPLPALPYSDEVILATELNRRSGQVLDRAYQAPVTIQRNDQSFALLRRDQIAALIHHAHSLSRALQAIATGTALLQNRPISTEDFAGLRAFDPEELQEFLQELLTASEQSTEAIETTLHEWQESAIAIQSPLLTEAFSAETDEVDLLNPEVILSQFLQDLAT